LVSNAEEENRLRVSENRVLRKVRGPKRVEVTGECRRLHKEELNDLYSPNIFRMIKSGRIRWAGHVAACGREERCKEVCLWGNLRERDYLEDLDVDRGIILKWILR
jgi:hypothetical protein